MDKSIKFIAIGAMALISFSVFYYFVIFLPSKERMTLEQKRSEFLFQENEKQTNKLMLDACLADALDSYNTTWNSNCRNSGIDRRGDGCALPHNVADSLNEYYKQTKDECYKKYPQR